MKTLEERFWAKVNKSSNCWTWAGCTNGFGYGLISVDGKNARAHRVSYRLANGPIPEGLDIDHICRNRLCVNPAHLRLATRKQNSEHQSAGKNNKSSGVRGVTRRSYGRWQGRVMHNGKSMSAGSFDTISEAEAAVIALRNKYFTHNALDKAA